MKGYFSQLARRTGLSFRDQSTGAGRVSSQPAGTAGSKASAAPIEVEEVTFTASSPSVGLDVSTSNISGASKISHSENQPASLVTPNDVSTSPTSTITDANQDTSLSQTEVGSLHDTAVSSDISLFQATAPAESRIEFVAAESHPPNSTTEQIFFREQLFDPSHRLTANTGPLTKEVEIVEVDAKESRHLPGDDDVSVDQQEVQNVGVTRIVEPGPPKTANTKEGKPLEQDRRRIFQDQLKEVMAWISSPPDEVEQSPPAFEVIEAQPDAGSVSAREREQGRSSERPISAREPQVQDLSLSIGTISIVVEEPKQDHPVSLSPPPPTHTSPQPVAPEPTRLSRYYLRNL